MGAKGRKRKQKQKTKHRTGLIKSLTGPYSSNQCEKRRKQLAERKTQSDAFKRYFGL